MARDEALRRLFLAACLVAGIAWLPSTVRAVRSEDRRGAGVPDVHGVPATRGMPEGTPELFSRVRELVPEHEPVRLIVRGTNCTGLPVNAGGGATFFAQYHLLPRPATCDPDARWWVYIGTPPGGAYPMPQGATATTVRPNLVIVHVP